MRNLRIAGLLALMLATPASLPAQPAKHVATVTMPEIETRSGPSWQFLPTGKLKKGEQVLVHHEDNGWLAVVPPKGSVSWVNHRFLGDYEPGHAGMQNAIIMKDNVGPRVGGEGKSGPLQVSRVSLPHGTIVKIVGPKARFEDTTWYPIEPPEGEYRYIPRQSVGALEPIPLPPVAVAKSVAAGPQVLPGHPGGQVTGGTGKTPEHAPTTGIAIGHPSWAKAEQAEAAGDWESAKRYYTQVYLDLRQKNADIDQLLQCYNRIDRCDERKRGGALNIPTQPSPGNGGRVPAALQRPGIAERPSNEPVVVVPSESRIEMQKPANAPPPITQTSASGEAKLASSGAGYLRKAPFFIDNRQAYALEGERGQLLYYVTTGQGANLEPHLNRQVELVGSPQVRGDIRGAQYMVVTKVIPLK